MNQAGHLSLNLNDANDRALLANVHPQEWQNPEPKQAYHLVIIGAGTAGLVTAAAAAGLGARVALVERNLMGGDCLNTGCVPSKGLIRSGRAVANVRDAGRFGVQVDGNVRVDFSAAMERLRSKRAAISPVDSARRFQALGVDVFFGNARFLDRKNIQVQPFEKPDSILEFRKAVIATGARAAIPNIPGLEQVEFLTNENLFRLNALPPRLGIIGAGPIGCEMAQTFQQLGSQVYLFEMAGQILPREDSEASRLLTERFNRDGIQLATSLDQINVQRTPSGAIQVNGLREQEAHHSEVDQLLVSTGRKPNIENLGLEAAGVESQPRGVVVNDFLQTTNPRIYAAGDVASPFQFTHAADFQARIVVQNALFAVGPLGRKRAGDLIIPAATYTSPEIAHVGLREKEAAGAGTDIDVYTQRFDEVDRAILDGEEEGFVKIITRKGTDKILGATIVANHAGDLISEIVVAMNHGVGLGAIASCIHPYPTLADAIRRTGDQYNRTRLSPFNQNVLSLLRKFNVGK